jgi:hypothetical protein
MSRQAKVLLWEGRIAAWRRSGLSQRAWCVQHGVAVQTFGYWCRRLSCVPAPVLLPIVVDGQTTDRCPLPVEVLLGNGVAMRLPSSLSSDVLSRWLRELRAC